MSVIWKRLAIAAVLVLVIFPIIKFVIVGSDHDVAEANSNAPLESVGNETQVLVAKESSEGVTNEQINLEVANAIGEKSLQSMRKHTDQILSAMRSSENSDAVRQETILATSEDLNVVITRFYLNNMNFAMQVSGIIGKEFIRVSCMAPRGDQKVLLPGKCAKALSEQFNFVFPGGQAR